MLEDVNSINDAIYDLGMLISDESIGMIRYALTTKYFDKYDKNNTLIDMFDCMVEEVNAINNVIELYDFLQNIPNEDWKYLLEDEISFEDKSYYELLELKKNIDKELDKRENESKK